MLKIYWLALGALGVWRITHLLHAEDGPWKLLRRLRQRLGSGFWGQLIDCFYCLSLWIAAPFAWLLGETALEKLLLWPAISAAACLLERVTRPAEEVSPAAYFEDPEEDHVLRT